MAKIAKPRDNPGLDVNRRGFFSAVAAGAAGGIAARALPARADETPAAKPAVAAPNAATTVAETQPPASEPKEAQIVARSGSDFMVDVLKTLPLDYVATMPGSTFRGLHESLINYGMNKSPELIMCLHEEIACGMGHGYAKVAQKPMGALVHGVVGIQHGSMAIYNAWADRVPVFVMAGNTLNSMERRPGVEWTHSAQDNAALVRDFTKWDDMPMSLGQFGESGVRAWQISMTPPYAPTMLIVDGELAEKPIAEEPDAIPKLTHPTPPVGDPDSIKQAAQMLTGAQFPVIVIDRAVRTQHGMDTLVQLSETLGAPVIDKGGRLNMPSHHPLNYTTRGPATLRQADVILAIEVADLYGALNNYRDRIVRDSHPIYKPGTKIINLTAATFLIHSNFQDFQRYQPADLAISGDGEATLPLLLAAVQTTLPKSSLYEDRAKKLSDSSAAQLNSLRQAATYAWDASPVSVARLCMETMAQVENDNWALVTAQEFQMNWPSKLWNFTKPWQHIGGAGGYGVGYSGPSSIGAALAHRDAGEGRIPIAILGDGELMCCPGTFWTAAHHRIPILMVMHNNRAYHQELMHVQRMADRHARGVDRAWIGTVIDDPAINFAKMADSMGVWSIGPISDPTKLAAALQQAVAVVKSGQPALVDVVCQPR
jgi:acetolactate synthase I/II/III large subunit